MGSDLGNMWNTVRMAIDRYVAKYARGAGIKIPDLSIHRNGLKQHARLAKPIECFNWPYKQVSDKKKCHIFVQGNFVCGAETVPNSGHLELESYVTRIAWYKPTSHKTPKTVTGLDGYHFDMDEPLQIAHPVFHVQRRSTLLDDEIQQFNYEINPQAVECDQHHQIRIPTPQFDLMSALLMIIADHLVTAEGDRERDFLALVDKVREKNKLKASPSKQAHLYRCEEKFGILPGHWYAPGHRPVP